MKKYSIFALLILIAASVLLYFVFNNNLKESRLKKEIEMANYSETKNDLIRLEYPRSNDEISSPLIIKGEARGYWFFEASFPVVLVDSDGLMIAQGIATAKSDWMTENFVPFKAELKFEKPEHKENGVLILKKDNPSGLPENDDALEIPVIFK